MRTASAYFNDDDKSQIIEAVRAAESMTSCEIVPVVATASGRYDRSEDIFGVIVSLVLVSVYWLFFQLPPADDWSIGGVSQPPLWPVLLLIVLGFVAGAFLATVFPVLRLPFVAKQEMEEEVERRAMETFKRQRIRATKDSNGVLVYISLYEHMVYVAGDDAVNEMISGKDWQEIADIVVTNMKQGNPGHGIAEAVRKCGEILKTKFPHEEGDINELNDGLVILE